VLACGLAVALGVVLAQYINTKREFADVLQTVGLQAADLATMRHFWKPFIQATDGEPIVVFSNAEFTGRPETGLRYAIPGDSHEAIFDHYTGVGEVLGVHALDGVFAGMHKRLRIKRGRLLGLDDAQSHDLIFVGSPSENLPLRDLSVMQDFAFKRVKVEGQPIDDLSIQNLHPLPGEREFYPADHPPMMQDYAVISLVDPGESRYSKLLLAGISTLGTQAAVEFVCDPARVRDLLTRVTGSPNADIRPFEAVIKVKISKGVPILSEIVALHRH
jgi:hypothetical protein